MTEENRRVSRVGGELFVNLTLRGGEEGPVLVGPVKGVLSNISSHGAGLTVPHVHFGDFHLVYSAQDEETSETLFIEIFPPDQPEKVICLPVMPIWFDSLFMGQAMSFRIGVEFLDSPDDERIRLFEEMVAEMGGGSGGWWTDFLLKLWPQDG